MKREGYHGWTCNEEFGDPDALRTILIPLDVASLFATATATSIYLGPIPETAAHAGLMAVMESATRDVAAIAVRVLGRPAAVLMVDELGDTLTGTRRMDELARAVGDVPLASLVLEESRRFGRHTTVVVVTPSTSDDWAVTLMGLQSRGVKVAAVLLEAETFGAASSSLDVYGTLAAGGIYTYTVKSSDDLGNVLAAGGDIAAMDPRGRRA